MTWQSLGQPAPRLPPLAQGELGPNTYVPHPVTQRRSHFYVRRPFGEISHLPGVGAHPTINVRGRLPTPFAGAVRGLATSSSMPSFQTVPLSELQLPKLQTPFRPRYDLRSSQPTGFRVATPPEPKPLAVYTRTDRMPGPIVPKPQTPSLVPPLSVSAAWAADHPKSGQDPFSTWQAPVGVGGPFAQQLDFRNRFAQWLPVV